VTPKVTKYLDKNNLCFIIADDCNLKLITKSNKPTKNDTIAQESSKKTEHITNSSQSSDKIVDVKKIKTLVFEKTIRSGEEIVHDGDVTIFGRVNSAAKVIAEGNIEVYGTIDGLVQSDGDYMIVKDLGKGHIIFNGDILEKELFDGNLKKVTYSSNTGAFVKDIFETKNNKKKN
jgi:septum site-determining protein MinC